MECCVMHDGIAVTLISGKKWNEKWNEKWNGTASDCVGLIYLQRYTVVIWFMFVLAQNKH